MSEQGAPVPRPPFDPGRVRPPTEEQGSFNYTGGPDGPGAPRILTVSQLTRLVRGAIQKELRGEVHVVGELSNVSEPSGGHLYFTLKDASSEVRCVMWRSSARLLRFRLEDGMEVVASGSVDVYEPRGQYQLYVRRLEPRGVGALELALRQLKAKLEREGLFDPQRKRPLPRFPQRIAVVTSPTGAAIRDMLQTIGRRWPFVTVYVFGVRVQGEGAAQEIADAIRRINHSSAVFGGIDVMIVGRGGGSLEDLWAFNEEVVARAICASAIPVVSAVGHEIDYTIADFVADVRAATPTAAGELVVPSREELINELDGLGHRLVHLAGRVVDSARLRLTAMERSEWFRDPVGRIRQRQQQIDEATGRLQLAVERLLGRQKSRLHEREARLARVRPEALLLRRREAIGRMEYRLRWAAGRCTARAEHRLAETVGRLMAISPKLRIEGAAALIDQLAGRLRLSGWHMLVVRRQVLDALQATLTACSHEKVLNRGFSITRRAKDRRIVRKSAEVQEGERIVTQTADGNITSRVIDDRQGELFE